MKVFVVVESWLKGAALTVKVFQTRDAALRFIDRNKNEHTVHYELHETEVEE